MRSVLNKFFFLDEHLFVIVGLKFIHGRFKPRIILSNNYESVSFSLEDFESIFVSRSQIISDWFEGIGKCVFPINDDFLFFTMDIPKMMIFRHLSTHQCIKVNSLQFHRLLKLHPCIKNYFSDINEKTDLVNFSFSSMIVEAGETIKNLLPENLSEDEDIKFLLPTLEKTKLITEIVRIYSDVCVMEIKKYIHKESVLSQLLG